jgi:hypothetical protein
VGSTVVDEQIEGVREAVSEKRTRKRRAATEVTVDAALARPYEFDRGVGHDTAVKTIAH